MWNVGVHWTVRDSVDRKIHGVFGLRHVHGFRLKVGVLTRAFLASDNYIPSCQAPGPKKMRMPTRIQVLWRAWSSTITL